MTIAHTTIHHRMTAKEWLMLLTLSLFWGGSFYYIEIALRDLPPLTLVFGRVFIAAITLWLVVGLFRYRVNLTWSLVKAFVVMGLLNNVIPFCLISWGQTHVASGLASILNATTPLFAVVIAGLFLKDERMTVPKLAGTIVGFLGVGVMLGVSLDDVGTGIMLAKVAILGAGISYSCAGVFGRRFHQIRIHPVVAAAGQVTASSIILFPVAMLIDKPWQLTITNISTIYALLALAIISTAIAYIMYFRILATAGATNILLVTFLVPVSAVLLGVFALGEELKPVNILGMLAIGFGLTLIDGRLWGIQKTQNQPSSNVKTTET